MHESLRNKHRKAPVKPIRAMKYFVSLPVEEAYHEVHMAGGMHAMAQHSKVVVNIHKMVASGMNELSEMKYALKLYVDNLAKSPHQDERA